MRSTFIKSRSYVSRIIIVFVILFLLSNVGIVYAEYELNDRMNNIIPRKIFVVKVNLEYGDLIEVAKAIRNIVLESFNTTKYLVKEIRVRFTTGEEDIAKVLTHNSFIFRYVNWSALEDYVPIVRDYRFKEILRIGFFWEYFISVDDYVNWKESQYIERGVYSFKLGNGSILNGTYSIEIVTQPPGYLTITVNLRGYKSISKYVDEYKVVQEIVEKLFSWHEQKAKNLGLNLSAYEKVRIPRSVYYKLDLVNLTPPLPRIRLPITLSNGTRYLLEINDLEHAKRTHCLVVLVNNSSCLLHVRREGLLYYLGRGIWDPSKVFYKDEYERYLKLISYVNTTEIPLPKSVIRKYSKPEAMVYLLTSGLFYARAEISLGTLHIDMYSPILIAESSYDLYVPRSINIDVFFNYLNNSCPLINEYAKTFSIIYDSFPPPMFYYSIFYNISVMERFWSLVDELNRTYTDSLSRSLLDYVVRIILLNENLSEAKRTYRDLIFLGERALRSTFDNEPSIYRYYVLIPFYGAGNITARTFEFGAAIYVNGLRLLACANYSEMALEFWRFINSINPNALTKPLPELEKKIGSTGQSTKSTESASQTSPHYNGSSALTITLPPRATSTSSTTSLTTSTVGTAEETTASRVNYTNYTISRIMENRTLPTTISSATSTVNTVSTVNISSNLTISPTPTKTLSISASRVELPDMRLVLLILATLASLTIIVLKRYRG